MDLPYGSMRSRTKAGPTEDGPQDDGFVRMIGSATLLAHEAGKGMALARRWITDTALGKYPLTTLGMAFGLGVFAGWFVKRR
jgi:hypothetical protein